MISFIMILLGEKPGPVFNKMSALEQYNTNVLSLDFETAYWIVHQFEMRCLKTNFIADLREKNIFGWCFSLGWVYNAFYVCIIAIKKNTKFIQDGVQAGLGGRGYRIHGLIL